MKILNREDALTLEVKRFYPPFEVWDTCSVCGEEVEGCGVDQYLSYTAVNAPEPVTFLCDHSGTRREGEEWHEWERDIIIRITAEAAE